MASIFDQLEGSGVEGKKKSIFDQLEGSGKKSIFDTLSAPQESVFSKALADQEAGKPMPAEPTSNFTMPDTAKSIPSALQAREEADAVWVKKQWEAIRGGAKSAGKTTAHGIAGLAEMWGDVQRANVERLETNTDLKVPEHFKAANEAVGEWGTFYADAFREHEKEHPEESLQLESEGFLEGTKELLSNPGKLIQGGMNSIDLLMTGVLPGGVAIMAGQLAGQNYLSTKEDEPDPETRALRAWFTAVPEAAIERWTLGKKIALFKRMSSTPLRKATWETAKAYGRGMAEEGSQKINENLWRRIFTDPDQSLTEGVATAAATGGPLEAMFSGGAMAGGSIKNRVAIPKSAQLARAGMVKSMLLENTSDDTAAVKEIEQVFEKVVEDIEVGKYEPLPDSAEEQQAAERLAKEWSITGQEALKHIRKMREADTADPEVAEKSKKKEKPITPVVVAGKSTTVEDVMVEATAAASALPQRAVATHTRSLVQDIKGVVGGTWESTRRTLAKTLDGGNEDGPFTQVLHKNPEDGRAKTDEYITNLERLENDFREKGGITEERLSQMGRATNPRLGIAERLSPTIKKVPVDIRGNTWELTEGQMLSVYLSDMQIKVDKKGNAVPVGRDHMTKHGMRLAYDAKGTGPIPVEAIEQIKAYVDADPALSAIKDQYLTVEAPIQSGAINDTARRVGEPDIATLPNWYALHVPQDPKVPGRTFLDAPSKRSSIREIPGEFRIDPFEDQSIFNNRVGDGGDLVIHDFFEQRHHTRHAIGGYVGLAPSFRLARTVLNDPKIRRLLKERGYGNVDELLRHSFSRQQGSERMPMAQPMWMRRLMTNFYRSIGRLPHVVLIQATSVPTNMTVMDMPYAIQGLRGLANHKATKAEMLEHSAVMYQRYYGGFASMEAAEASGPGVVLRAMTGHGSHAELGSGLVREHDLWDLDSTWEGVKAEFTALKAGAMSQSPNALSWKWWKNHDVSGIEEGSDGYWSLIARRHQDAVQRAKPSWDAGNRTFLTSDPNAMKRSVLGIFRSFAGKMHESVIDARADYKVSDKSLEAKQVYAQRLSAVWMSFTAGYVLKELLRAGIRRELREPWEYAVGVATSPLSILPGVGTIIQQGTRQLVSAAGNYRGTVRSFDTFDSPYLEAPNQLVDGGSAFAAAAGHYVSGDTAAGNKAFKSAFAQTAETIGMFYFGIPTPIIRSALKGWAPSEDGGSGSATPRRSSPRSGKSGRRNAR